MKIKGVLLAGVAMVICGFSNPAEANNDRLSLYEINGFVTNLTTAINSRDALATRSFLTRNVSASASFYNTLNRAWADGRYLQPVWYNHQTASPYYRYPYAYAPHLNQVSYASMNKAQMITDLENKKAVIPYYRQSIKVVGTKMPADASSAVLDVKLKETGLGYGLSPYVAHYGQPYAHQVEYSSASCKIHLKKHDDQIRMTGMNCNTALNLPL